MGIEPPKRRGDKDHDDGDGDLCGDPDGGGIETDQEVKFKFYINVSFHEGFR